MFCVYFIGLFKDPTISVGMIGRLVRGAMNLARPIEYFVQTGWTIFVSFEWLLPLTGFRATESSVDHLVWAIFIISTLIFIASRLSIAIPDFGCAWVAGAAAGQPTILACAKAGHKSF